MLKKEEQVIQVTKTTTIGRQSEKKKKKTTHPELLRSQKVSVHVEFQEVEKDNLQIKENMEK